MTMDILLLLIPLSLVLVAVIGAAFAWSVRSGQFDDLDGPGHRILTDDDRPPADDATSAGDATLTSINPAAGTGP